MSKLQVILVTPTTNRLKRLDLVSWLVSQQVEIPKLGSSKALWVLKFPAFMC